MTTNMTYHTTEDLLAAAVALAEGPRGTRQLAADAGRLRADMRVGEAERVDVLDMLDQVAERGGYGRALSVDELVAVSHRVAAEVLA